MTALGNKYTHIISLNDGRDINWGLAFDHFMIIDYQTRVADTPKGI